MEVTQACLGTDLGVRRQWCPVEVNGVAVLNCCTTPIPRLRCPPMGRCPRKYC